MSKDAYCSSSGEEDGDAEWMNAINSIATGALNYFPRPTSPPNQGQALEEQPKSENHKLTHYQLKAQKVLNDILEKSIEVVSSANHLPDEDSAVNGGGVQLFKNAPCGIVFDPLYDVIRPHKRPRILPMKEINEKSKAFKRQVLSVAVEGTDIIAAAREACQKSLAKQKARDAAATLAAKREVERVAELKRTRGERWLPCMIKDRQLKSQN